MSWFRPDIASVRNAGLLLLLGLGAVPASAVQPSTGRLSLEPAQPTYYVGQTVRMVVELELVDCELGGNLQLGGMPDATWARHGSFEDLAPATRTREGRLVTTKRFATDLCFLSEGRHRITPSLAGTTAERQRRGMMTLWTHEPFGFALPALAVDVLPIPAPSPADFCGVVGRFTLKAEVSPTTVSPGDLVNLRWWLEGFGTLDKFLIPEQESSSRFRAYPAREEARVAGRRVTVAQVLVPQAMDATSLPALALSVFDPEAGRYVRLTAGPFALTLVPRSAELPPVSSDPRLVPSVAAPNAARPVGGGRWAVAPSMAPPMLVLLGGLALAVVVFSALVGRSRWGALVLAVATLGGALGIRQALFLRQQRGVVVLAAAVESRLCPSATARVLATLPEGATVRVLEHTGRWLRVEHDGASGWIPEPEGASAAAVPR